MGSKGSILAFVILIALPGCVGTITGDGVHWALAGTYYGHSEEPVCGQCETGEESESRTWTTVAGRAWGTNGLEGKITSQSETVSIQGEGMSEQMQKTLGDDLGKDIVSAVSKATPAGGAAAAVGSISEALDDDKPPAVVVVPLEPEP